jgi:hypothetical protein
MSPESSSLARLAGVVGKVLKVVGYLMLTVLLNGEPMK